MNKRLFLAFILWALFPLLASAQTAAPTINEGAYNPGSGGGGTPGGTNNTVQINSAGSFGGVGPGTSGQVLTSNGSASAPTYQTISGTGTVTTVSVVPANGLAGTVATATTTPAITLSTSITGLLKGNGTAISAATAGTDYQTPISLTTTGTSGAATFSGGVLNIPQYSGGGGGGVSSFTGDNVVLNNSASTGAVTATLANAGAYTALGNFTGSSAAPTYSYIPMGLASLSSSSTLTANSPSYLYVTAASVTTTLPVASTCIGKIFVIENNSAATTNTTVNVQGSDSLYYISGASVTSWVINPIGTLVVQAQASTKWQVIQGPAPIFPLQGVAASAGGVMYGTSANYPTVAYSAGGVSGQLLQSAGTSAPIWTSTPTLTSITATTATTPVTIETITGDTDGATITFNLATSNWHSVTLGGNRTLALSNATTGQQFTLVLTQDGTGSRTVTWFSGITWNGGQTPVLQTAAGAVDTITFKCTGAGTYIGYPTLSGTGALVNNRTAVADAAYAQLATDNIIGYTSISAARIVTLTSTGIAKGQQLIVKDESGSASGTNTITVSGVNIDGGTSKVINAAYGVLRLYYNGSTYSTW